MKGFVWDPFVIGVTFFVVAVIAVIFLLLWSNTAPKISGIVTNSTNAQKVVAFGNGFYYDSLDALAIFLYFIMILASFLSAAYEGANPAVTLVLGIFFLMIAVLVSFGLSDAGHAFMAQNAALPLVRQHLSGTLYLMDNLPDLTGIFIIAYIVFVITRRSTGQVGSGNIISG